MVCKICGYETDSIVEMNLHFRENHWEIYASTEDSIWSYINGEV